MVKGVLDNTSTSSDFYTVFDNIVSTNPQLNQKITDARNENNLFLVKVLRFYTHQDLAYVEELGTRKKYNCHLTHEMLSYEVALNCMCEGTVGDSSKYGTYVKPYSNVYGIVANVRFKGNTDEKCLLSCLNYDNDNNLKSNVQNGEIRISSGDSSLSITRERINLLTPNLFINGLPYNEPALNNYYDKKEISVIKSSIDVQLNEINNTIENINLETINEIISELEEKLEIIEGIDFTQYMSWNDYTNDLNNTSSSGKFLKAIDNTILGLVSEVPALSTLYNHIKTLCEKWFYNKNEVNILLSGKVNTEAGKGLSSNDFTNTYKNSLDNLPSNLNNKVNVIDIVDSLNSTDTNKPLSANQGRILNNNLNNKNITVEEQGIAEEGYLKTYIVKQGGVQVGTKINIPKDFLVKGATVKTVIIDDAPVIGYVVGDKYLDFIINARNNSEEDEHLYILVSDLVDTEIEWNNILNKPTTYPPSSHNHAISNITNLQTTLNNKGSRNDDVDWGYNNDSFIDGLRLVPKSEDNTGRIDIYLND